MMTTYYIMLVGFLAIILIAVILKQQVNADNEEIEAEWEHLNSQITFKRSQLQDLENQIEHKQTNPTTNLPHAVESILDEYDIAGIRLPADIIEELHIIRFRSDNEIRSFIENQRHSWKLECSKKPLKAVKK